MESYVTYALNRIFDTGIGVIMALVVNSVFPGGFTFRFMERFYRLFRKTAEEPANMIEKTEDERDGISN